MSVSQGETIDSEVRWELAERFVARFGAEPELYSAYYYDATRLAAEAVRDGGTDGESIRRHLNTLSESTPFLEVTGKIWFDGYSPVRTVGSSKDTSPRPSPTRYSSNTISILAPAASTLCLTGSQTRPTSPCSKDTTVCASGS